MASRVGPIHTFDGDSPVSRDEFVKAMRGVRKAVPVVVMKGEDEDDAEIVGKGTLNHVKVSGSDLIGTINWSDDLEKLVGKSTPSAYPEFNEDGTIRRIVVDLDDNDFVASESDDDEEDDAEDDDHEEGCGCEECEAGGTCQTEVETKAKNTMPLTDVDILYARILERHDGDPERAAKSLLKLNMKLKENQIADDEVAIAKSDAELLEKYRDLGEPDDIQAIVESVEAYREIDPDPAKLKTRVAEADSLRSDLDARNRADSLRGVAESLGYNPDVFVRRIVQSDPRLKSAEFVAVKRKDRANREIESFDVKTTGDDGAETVRPIEDYEREEWADMLPVLRLSGPIRIAREEVGRPAHPGRPAPAATGYNPPPRTGRPVASPTVAKATELARDEVRRDFPAMV